MAPQMSTIAAPTEAAGRDRLLAPKLMVALFLVLRVAFDAFVPPVNDETYYWLWGQRPALSYFDHPPLLAWLQGLASLLFGWNLFSLRALTWVTTALAGLILWRWTARLAPEDRQSYFWYGAAIYLASPVMSSMSTLAFNDHVMLVLCLASAWCFTEFTARFEAGERRPGWLYCSGALLGLAVLAKYNAAFLGAGYLILVLARPGLRPLLRYPHAWAAGGLAVALQLPVLIWAMQTDFASFRFHLAERGLGESGTKGFSVARAGLYMLGQLFWLSPFLWIPLIRYARARQADTAAAQRRTLALATLVLSSLVMAGLAFGIRVLPYWTDVGFLLVLVFVIPFVGRRVAFWGHMATGIGFALVMLVNLAVLPVATVFGQNDRGSAVLHGWDAAAAAVREAQALHPDAFLASTHFALAAPLGYALRTTDIATLSVRRDQFDYWFDDAAAAGRDAIVFTDRARGIKAAEPRFESLTQIAEIPVERFGHRIHSYLIYLGKSYRPEVDH